MSKPEGQKDFNLFCDAKTILKGKGDVWLLSLFFVLLCMMLFGLFILLKKMKGRIWWGEVPGAGCCQICVSAPPVERKHRRNIIAPNRPPPYIYFQI